MPDPAPSDSALCRLEGVSKSFGELRALDGLDLEVRRGEVLGLLGPNGAGKTTALRILCGLLRADEGRVTIDELDVQTEPLEARRRYGYVPEGAPLYANLSPRQHLHLVGRLHGVEDPRLSEETNRMLDALELLVLDEPLSGLDAPTTAVIKELLRAWAERGGAVLYTSHLLDVVERVCDRIVLLSDGAVAASGTFEELQAAGRGESLERIVTELTSPGEHAAVADRIVAAIRCGEARTS